MESKNKFFLLHAGKIPNNLNRRKKTILGKNTSDNSELLRPGAQAWRREPKPFLFPSFQNRRVRCRWTIGWSLVPWPLVGVCSGRITRIANCCHSQEEGGGQGIMTQVFVGWYSLQGCFLSQGAPRLLWGSTQHLVPTEQSVQHCALYSFPATPFPSPSGMREWLRRSVSLTCTHAMPQPSAEIPCLGPLCTTAWLSRCYVLVPLLKLHLRKIKQSLKITHKGFVKSVMNWLLERFSRLCGWNVRQIVPAMLKAFDVETSRRSSGNFLLKNEILLKMGSQTDSAPRIVFWI